jgi:hypothetical protein
VVDLKQSRHYCSCPGRRKPCKHILALLQLWIDQPDAFSRKREQPSWVRDWLKSKDRLLTAAEKKAVAQQRKEQRQRSRDLRIEQMQEGAADLMQWLLDLVRKGLAQAPDYPEAYWEDTAARMVDAKLGSIGRRVRQWPPLLLQENWHEKFLAEIAELYLLARSLQRLDQLPDSLRQEVLTVSGLNIKKETVLKGKGFHDHWLVAGITEGGDDNLHYRRTWLIGEQNGQPALLLDFAWGGSHFDREWKAGMGLHAELVYYPGAYPVRALIRREEPSKAPFETPDGYPDLEAFANAYAAAISANPWLVSFPALLDNVIPVRHDNLLLLIDDNHKQLPATTPGSSAWQLLALSTGQPLTVFGEWDGQIFQILSVIADNRLVVMG